MINRLLHTDSYRFKLAIVAVVTSLLCILFGCCACSTAQNNSNNAQASSQPEHVSDKAAHVDNWPAAALKLLQQTENPGSELYMFGVAASAKIDACKKELRAQIDLIEQEGNRVNFVLVDPEHNLLISYFADEPFVSQSAIKAPFIASVLEQRPEALLENEEAMSRTIINSDNAMYEMLKAMYGSSSLMTWCENLDLPIEFATYLYPAGISARDMAKLWTSIYSFLQTQEPDYELASWLSQSNHSVLRMQLGEVCKVLSKPGWTDGCEYGEDYPPYNYTDGDVYNDELATNDAGLVFTDEGCYLAVIFTDYPDLPYKLLPLVQALHDTYLTCVSS